jgi:hypothetical protein
MRVAWWLAVMLLATGCKRVTSSHPAETDSGVVSHTLEGTWRVFRTLDFAAPQPPRSQTCPPFDSSYQPTWVMIDGTTLVTDSARPIMNVTWFGIHDLTFQTGEAWTSVDGYVDYVAVRYQIDQVSPTDLYGMANTIVSWPAGPCAYELTVTAQRQ